MRKIALIFAVFFVSSMSSNAFVDNTYMTTEQYMVNTGYSAEMAKMIRVTNQDPYREPYVEPNAPMDVLKRVYNYIVPGAYTDLDFYNHSINYKYPNWKDY